MKPVSSWGRLPTAPHHVVSLNKPRTAAAQMAQSTPGIAYGKGRSYGDVCLNPGGTVWATSGLDRFSSFDSTTGVLACGAGTLLRDIQRLCMPRGWLLPVTPGTQIVTVGGAIANDVHGKNHHGFGSFGDHVLGFTLQRTDGEIIKCGPNLRPDWFAATIGGLGLTGVILDAELQMRAVPGPWLETETLAFSSLAEFFHLSDQSVSNWEYGVAWIDCTTSSAERGLFSRARPTSTVPAHAPPSPKSWLAMPFTPPISVVNRLTLRPFNLAFFGLGKSRSGKSQIKHYESFLYPLDHIGDWNRMYGPRGFYQHQSVVPRQSGEAIIGDLLRQIARSNTGSFLAVLKTFGDRGSRGLLGFPRPGVTLALDFPNNGSETLNLLTRLDAIVAEAGGAVYAAKDARMPRSLFESGYPRLNEFLAFRDPGIRSGLSLRLMGL